MLLYVLIGDSGEYQSFYRNVLGVFTSEAAAREAIPKFEALAEAQYAMHKERQRRRDAYMAATFEPTRSEPASAVFPDGFKLYRNEQYAQAEAHVGPEVPLVPGCDSYEVQVIELDAIAPPRS